MLDVTQPVLLQLIEMAHWIAGFIVLAEGLNKLERCAPLQRGLSRLARTVVLLKVMAWVALVLGAGGAVLRPFIVGAIGGDLHLGRVLMTDRVSLADLLCLGGFALLIVRSRLKEPLHHDQQPQPR
jgi:hypothetical protein